LRSTRRVCDRFAHVGGHRRVKRDPTRIVATPPLPQPRESLAGPGRQADRAGKVDQQPGAGSGRIRGRRLGLQTCLAKIWLAERSSQQEFRNT
jgi:hypothetical protein